MTEPTSKDELLKEINTNFIKLGLELDTLPPVLVNDKSIQAHADGVLMTPCDLVAHAIGWTELALKWFDNRLAGRPVDLPETGYCWEQIDRLALAFYAEYNTAPFKQLRASFAESKSRLTKRIDGSDNAVLFGTSFRQGRTMGQMLHRYPATLYEDERIRLRIWKKGLGWV